MLARVRAPLVVRACAHQGPKKNKIKAKDIKRAINHAQLLCFNFDDTIECRIAWDRVEELSAAYHDQSLYEVARAELELDEDRRVAISRREYDL